MKRMKILVWLVVCVQIVTVSADSNKQTYRDAQGRNMGSASTDRYGKTTYRDSMGRNQGSSSTDRYGKTTYRDARGRIQVTKKKSGLLEAAEDLLCDDLTIVTHDEAEDLVVRGHRIAVVPVWKYLLKA